MTKYLVEVTLTGPALDIDGHETGATVTFDYCAAVRAAAPEKTHRAALKKAEEACANWPLFRGLSVVGVASVREARGFKR